MTFENGGKSIDKDEVVCSCCTLMLSKRECSMQEKNKKEKVIVNVKERISISSNRPSTVEGKTYNIQEQDEDLLEICTPLSHSHSYLRKRRKKIG